MHLSTRHLLTTPYSLLIPKWPPYKRLRESHRYRRMRLRSRMSPGNFHRFYQRMMRHRRRSIIFPAILTPRIMSS